MRPARRLLPLALLAAAGACSPSAEPAAARHAWQGALPEGAWVRVRNASGPIEVRRSPDARVAIGADIRTGGERVTWVRDSTADGMTFCVLFGRDPGRSCDRATSTGRVDAWSRVRRALTGRREGGRRVAYVLYVPADARVDVRTVNGDIAVASVVRDFRARTVNGAIRATAVTGGFDVETVNGSVEAALDPRGDGDISLESVNGSVSAELPASLDGEVALTTVNGRATSDFALEGDGRRRLKGTLGAGGREVTLKTVNGSVELRRRG